MHARPDLFVASAELDKVIWYSNLASGSGKIIGRVFNDINNDGIFNGSDHGLMNVRVESTDLGATYTNASGIYWFDAVPAGYMVSLPSVPNWILTTVDQYDVTVPTLGSSQDNDFGLHADGVVSELTPDLGSAPLRCGQNIHYWGGVQNTGNQVSDVQLTLNLDALSAFVWSDPMPTSIDAGVATWLFSNVQPTHLRSVDVVVHLPGSAYVGDTLHDQLHATALVSGVPVSSHIGAYDPKLVCAIDPNDKTVLPEGVGAEHLTAMDALLTYTVRFQNTGNAAASSVIILDTIDGDLDPSTLRIISSSHTQRTLIEPNGVVNFIFDNINLPDSGTDQLASNGFVRFSIRHHEGLTEGTQINNMANIYFDNNAPVVTNTTLNTLTYGMQTGVVDGMISGGSAMSVFPNPAQGTTTVRLSDDFQGRVDVDLFNATGGIVRHVSRRANTLIIDRGELPDGVYLLRATDERGVERTTRLEFER